MGRYVSSGSSGVGGSSATPAITTTVTTGEAVTQGQIAVVGADGLAYYGADQSAVANAVRAIYNPTPTANSFLSNTPANPAWPNAVNSGLSLFVGTSTFAASALSNGNFVIAWQLNATPFTVQFAIFNNAGVQQGATVNVDAVTATDTVQFSISIAALTGGGFALTFARNIAPWMQYAVYDNTGAVVKALTTVNAAISSNNGMIQALPLSNGGFALLYMALTNSLQNFVTFDASGTIVVTHTPIGGASPSGFVNGAAFTAAQGGGFVVAYSTPSAGTKVTKYTNAGVVSVAAQATSASNYAYSAVAVLTGGGFAVATAKVDVSVYNAAGVQVGTTTLVSVSGSGPLAIAALAGGGVAVCNMGATGNTVLTYWSGTTGLRTNSVLFSALPLQTGSNACVAMLPTKEGGVSIIATLGGNNISAVLDASASLVIPYSTVTPSYAPYGAGPPLMIALPSTVNTRANLAIYASTLSANVFTVGLLNLYMQKYVPIGVFAASAAQGAAVPVQYTGNAVLATGFTQPYSVDAQSASPPGQRMNVVGNSAVMNGIQNTARARRSIN